MRLSQLFEETKALTNDQIFKLMRTQLCTAENHTGSFYYDIFLDVPVSITNQQYDQLIRKSVSQEDMEDLRDIEVIQGGLPVNNEGQFYPQRVDADQMLGALNDGQRWKVRTISWKDYIKELEEHVRFINSTSDDFKDDL